MKKQLLGLTLLFLAVVLFSTPAQATHIQYFSYADNLPSFSTSGQTWSHTFKLTEDDMELWNIEDATWDENSGDSGDWANGSNPIPLDSGSYDPDYDLHYVTLRIDPNNYTGGSTSDDVKLEVNGLEISGWNNPIRLYNWGNPNTSNFDDSYGIPLYGSGYEIEVKLTALTDTAVSITNVNLEGCFDGNTTPVPEPATLLLLGVGLVGLVGLKRRK